MLHYNNIDATLSSVFLADDFGHGILMAMSFGRCILPGCVAECS